MAPPIPNAGSTARDQLANERTFLAWVRTGLGFVGIGVVLEKLIESHGAAATTLGTVFIAGGLGQLVYALWRYRRVSELLVSGQYAPARRGPIAVIILSLALAFAAGVVVWL